MYWKIFWEHYFFILLSAKTFLTTKNRAGFLAWNSALKVTFVVVKIKSDNYEQRYTF